MKKFIFRAFLTMCLSFLIPIVTCETDPEGYLVYCPCMGRFGNQADHFLGALGFAHELNRTLILPPWVEYRKGELKSIQVPFDTYFKIDPLLEFHKVITMEKFMSDLAPTIWPPEKRLSMCYSERIGIDGNGGKGCNAKDGNPFGPFWDTFRIDFVDSQFYGPKLHYDIHNFQNTGKEWNEKFPASEWPVLAFTGAPAMFPVQDENRGLQQFLKRSNKLDVKAKEFIKNVLPKGAFIGIHLRNGIDWVRACEHVKGVANLFSSAQCLGYRNEKGHLTQDMCMPPKELIIRKLKRLIKKVKTTNKTNPIKSIFVASDNNHMMEEFNDSLKRLDIKVFKLPKNDPQLDLTILGKSNYFIGNCVSSYSSFVKRERDVKGFPSSFWGFPVEKQERNAAKHEEL